MDINIVDPRTKKGKLKMHCWSDKNNEKPYEVTMNNARSFLFNCDECNEEFMLPLNYVIAGHWCSKCTVNPPLPKNNVTMHMGKSFAGFT